MKHFPIGYLEQLNEYLHTQIIGQEKTLTALANTIKSGCVRLNPRNRPRGTLFLLGPTGVGKTESIRAVCEFIYGDPDSNLLRLDMSEFSRQAGEEALINLIGAPGGKTVGRLGEFLRTRSEGIILYDEIEKAHPLIFTIMLQQLDAARITLSDNTTHDLSHFFIVATSNIGAHTFQSIKHLSERRLQQNLEMQLKERFSPEFVARFGKFDHEILIFRPLKPEHLRLIARKFYMSLLPGYQESHQIAIHGFTDEVVEETLRHIDNTRNGARELRSIIERKIRAFMYELLSRKASTDIEGFLDVNPADPEKLILISNPPQNRRIHSCR